MHKNNKHSARQWNGLSYLFFGLVCCQALTAQAQVPAEFAGLYLVMEADLTNFEATVDTGWNGIESDCQFASVLLPATDGGEGSAASNTNYLKNAVIPFLTGLTNLGIRTVKFSISFPTLYQPYYDSTNGLNFPAGYTNMLNFYTNLVGLLRRDGLKVIIPTQNIFPVEQPAISNYYNSITFAEYTNGRSSQIKLIARVLKPDYLLMQSEPITEVDNLPEALGSRLNNPVTDTNMLMGFLNDLQNAGLRTTNMLVGAGMGTWQPEFDTYLTNFVQLPLDILDVHVYPINRTTNSGVVQDFLGRILTMADVAHSHGMKVGMGECWLQKEYDDELADPPSTLIFQGRDTYSFWSPLDSEFLLCMVEVGHYKQFEFIDPFWTDYYFAYLDYTNEQPKLSGLSADAAASVLNSDENSAAYAALAAHSVTNTGLAYKEYLQTNPPSLTLTLANGNSLNLAWTPVAVHYLLEQTSDLQVTNWTFLAIPGRSVGADYSAPMIMSNNLEFFKLQLP
ncbi:MAG: hypothetical protein ABSH48_26890 [Verrucomicrobiota bacterium]